MGNIRFASLVVAVTLMAAPMAAQERVEDASRPERLAELMRERTDVWLKGQALLFQNFFQAGEGQPEEDVLAGQGEVGVRVQPSAGSPLALFASYNYLTYDDEQLDKSDGFRVGLASNGRVHLVNAHYDMQRDRPTFDVGDVFARADVQTIEASYGYRFTRRWQAGAELMLQEQDVDLDPMRNNEFEGFGASVRYRPSRRFSPEIGFMTGTRDVADPTQSYDQDDLYLQIRSALTPALYASVRYRHRERSYASDAGLAGSRNDLRHQVSGYADYRLTEALTLNLYGAWESADSSLLGRDFVTSLWIGGLTYAF